MESPVSTLETLLSDLGEESSELDALVSDLTEQRWATPTTPEGWTVAHQVGHLIRTDEMSLRAIDDPDGFFTFMAEMRQQGAGQRVDVAAELAALPAALLLERWRQSRRDLAEALKGVPSGAKIAWAGPPMSAASMATARLMETWAHSLDVHDAFGMEKPPTDRVRHVCHLGIRTRNYAHLNRGEQPPDVEVKVELIAPSGEQWTWGADDAPERVAGSAWEFAMLVTRRRHRDDTTLVAVGPSADHWLDIAQAFAGQPGNDPRRLADRA